MLTDSEQQVALQALWLYQELGNRQLPIAKRNLELLKELGQQGADFQKLIALKLAYRQDREPDLGDLTNRILDPILELARREAPETTVWPIVWVPTYTDLVLLDHGELEYIAQRRGCLPLHPERFGYRRILFADLQWAPVDLETWITANFTTPESELLAAWPT